MSYKILIVDDEPENLRALERLFRGEYQVTTTNSASEALEQLEKEDFALLITDQRMPVMTGIELLKITVTLRPRMVRIILTGYTDTDALVEAINCGQVYKYITKPWSNEDLKLTVKRALEHYEVNRGIYNLSLSHERLLARMGQIQELATLEQQHLF
jgi:DNA-binding NtrC family response regulator